MQKNTWCCQKTNRRNALLGTFYGSLALTSIGRAQDRSTIAGIRETVEKHVQRKEIAGAVTMVVDKDRILHLDAAGFADLASNQPMTPEHLFWIASMSKPVTAICMMMLVDEGLVSLEDPISKYLPEMKQLKNEAGDKVEVTVLQTLNHTSGMRELAAPYADESLAQASSKYARLPVHFTPGSKWQYSQTGINTAARIVEVVSMMRFDAFLQKRLCDPLNLSDTAFYLSPTQQDRLAKSYARTPEGELKESPIFLLAGKQPKDRNRLPAANGGLFSTATDYARICQMLLSGGTWQGKRILSEKAVERLGTPTTGELSTGFTNGNAWGIGCCVVRQPQGATSMLSKGTYGHGGAYGTQAWMDPIKGRAYLLFVQRANYPNADASELRAEFQELATRGL